MAQNSTAPANLLFLPATDQRGKIDEAIRSKIIRYRFVNVDTRLLATQGALKDATTDGRTLILNLFEDAVFPAVLERREIRSGTSSTWFGRIDGVENSQVTLVVENSTLAGNVRLAKTLYEIRYAGEGTHVIYQLEPNAFPKEGHPIMIPDRGK